MVIKAHLKLIKNTSSSKNIKPNPETLRKTYRCSYFPVSNFQLQVVEIGRYITPIPNYYHLATALVPINAYTSSIVYTKYAESRSGINKRSKLMAFTSKGMIGIRYCL